MFFLLYALMTTFLTIFQRFPTTFQTFLKIFQNWSQTNIPKHFPKISKDFRWLPFEEDPKMFWSYTNEFKYNLRDKLEISEITDIFTSEDVDNTPLESRM